MNEQTGEIFKATEEEMKKRIREAEAKGQAITELTEKAAKARLEQPVSERVPFYRNVPRNRGLNSD